jgi:Suppressor of fused protein (SUFU)
MLERSSRLELRARTLAQYSVAASPVAEQHTSTLLERAWTHREESVYPTLFGRMEHQMSRLTHELFASLGSHEVEPRWLRHGVLVAPPNANRASWLYVTSGLSNPNDARHRSPGRSGIGCEFVLETRERADWAIWRLQHVLAFEHLLAAGRFPGKPLLTLYDRLPLRAPIEPESRSSLTWLLVVPSPTGRRRFRLESGWVHLLHLVGITDGEASYARREGGGALVELLEDAGAYPVTNPGRVPVVNG